MFLFRHWCAIHNSEEMVKIAVQHLQESVGEYELWVAVWYLRYEAQALSILSFLRVGDIMRVVRFLDCPSEDEEGETALMLAAKRKNRSFSKLLLYTQNQLICMYICMLWYLQPILPSTLVLRSWPQCQERKRTNCKYDRQQSWVESLIWSVIISLEYLI